MDIIHGDRRSDRRYPIELKLRYRAAGNGTSPRNGGGKTCDISRHGISFEGDESLALNSCVQLSIDWPLRSGNGRPLKLMVLGRVVRSDERATVVKTSHYEFRTREFAHRQSRTPAA